MTEKELERIDKLERALAGYEGRDSHVRTIALQSEDDIFELQIGIREMRGRLDKVEATRNMVETSLVLAFLAAIIVGLTYIGQFIWS